ncbi:MAG: AbrB/MazE/SpoVT family DNA-binding domain-containing protein [Atribacterota bacterium]
MQNTKEGIKIKTMIKVSSKYQIVIPREVREKLNLKTGDKLIIKANNEKIIIYPQPKSYAKYSLGLGKEIWQGVDATEYVKKERQTWKS